MDSKLQEGDVLLCTVDRIVGTVVFVKIDGDGEGSIITSEIAPGRIRNLRDYVVPKKRIVCKVLRVSGDRIDLSLRRVSLKEQKEVLERAKLEKNYQSILKTVAGSRFEQVLKEISQKNNIIDFFQEAKTNQKELEKILSKSEASKILEILNSQKKKTIEVKKEFNLSTTKPEGILLIRKILEQVRKGEVVYISAGRYVIKMESTDAKNAENSIKESLNSVEKQAREFGLKFSIREK
jgi:translation initiation factor 2 alpha subunit (eIF-2alpha)